MDYLMIVLRIVHIFSGVTWAGGAIVMTAFVGPTAKELGDDASKFMQQLSLRSRFVPTMVWVAILTPISGIWMYWHLFYGINVSSGAGLALTFGGVFGLIGAFLGFYTQKRNIDRVKKIVAEIAASGGPPKPEQMAEIQSRNEAAAKGGALTTVALVLAILGMTLSEYFAI